mgnify:CR=1 FL=1
MVGEEVSGGLDDVSGKAAGEVAVRRGLLEEGDCGVLKMEPVRLVDAADVGVEVVADAVGREDDVTVLGRLWFQDRVGTEEGPANPVQWVRGKRKGKPFQKMGRLQVSLLYFHMGVNRPWPAL